MKTRPFPKAKSKEERGDICKLCDRKFYVLAMVADSKKKIDASAIMIQ